MRETFLVAIIALTVIILLGHWYSNWWVKRFVIRRHEEIQEVYDSGEIPNSWTRPERKMKSLMRYVQGSRLIADEETREEVYARLGEILAAWQAKQEDADVTTKNQEDL